MNQLVQKPGVNFAFSSNSINFDINLRISLELLILQIKTFPYQILMIAAYEYKLCCTEL